MYTEEQLDFAYRYPFSEEAKTLVRSLDMKDVERAHVLGGKARVEEALKDDRLEFVESNYGKMESVLSYVYARMLVSALKNSAVIRRYATAESKRAAAAMEKDTDASITKLSNELGLQLKKEDDSYRMAFVAYLDNMPEEDGLELANQRLVGGTVLLDRHRVIKVLGIAIKKSIEKGLPIKLESIPKIVVAYSKEIKVPYKPVAGSAVQSGKVTWIDRLMQTPIPDCRHRTVNLVLAPYLVNGKGMPVDKAVEAILNYIALCKTVNPDTNITERYIRYQCEYAKSHGLRHLSLKRAKTELGAIDFKLLLGEDKSDSE